MAASQKRVSDFLSDKPLGLQPGDPVTLTDIVYEIFWATPGTEQFGNKPEYKCFVQGMLLDCLCRIEAVDLPF